MTAAAAGLLAAYTLAVAQTTYFHHRHGQVLVHIGLNSTIPITTPKYAVFSATAWSLSPWGKPCSTAGGAAQFPDHTSGLNMLCKLPGLWKDCSKGIYLDIGSNVGVQIRKLYNAHQFPDAPVLPVFEKVFGSDRAGVCAIGVEANPHHTAYLQTLNSYFFEQGYPAIILTEVAASTRSGRASFFLDPNSPVEWGASLTSGAWQTNNNGSVKADVELLNLPSFIADVVRPILKQELHTAGVLPPVAMKLDVEGEEYSLVPGLMLSGGLCDLSTVFLEVHPAQHVRNNSGAPAMTMPEMQAAFAKLRAASPQCRVEISNLDDESYLDGKEIPLPVHNNTRG